MNTTLTVFLSLLIWPAVYAGERDETMDSLSSTTVLNEVVVEAQMQTTTSKVTTYIPSSRQKNAANDAASLLTLMSIPQLSINPVTDAVKTAGGQPVSVFIDCTEATPEDMSGLNPSDVKRVEYYNSPSDPRFMGRKHVVNFVMQKYEWGGYTKTDAAQSFGVTNTDASVYSKMKYKAMSYDVYAGEQYSCIRNAGDETFEYMRFNNLGGNGPATAGRLNSSTTGNSIANANDIAFRAIYDSDMMQINNRASLNYVLSPGSETTNNLTYSNDMRGDATTRSVASSRNLTARYAGQYVVMFPKNLTVNTGTRFEYGNNRINSTYNGTDGFEIMNNAYEKSFFGTVNPNLSWQINDSHSVRAYMAGTWQKNRISYEGNSSSRQSYGIGGYLAGASYDFDTEKWSTHLNFGWTWQTNSISDYRIRTSYPRINAEAVYSPTQNTQLLASYEYYETYPTASSTSPVVIRQDELVSYAGNPTLKNSPSHEVGVQCVWLPSNKWQLAVTGFHYNVTDRRVANYLPEGPDGTMLRYYINNGNYICTMAGCNATARFMGGRLTARVNPQLWFRKTTGVFAMRRNEITCSAQLTYYFGDFHASGWFVTPSHYPDENSGIECKTPSQYELQLGWGNGTWNLGISASNFLRSEWRSNRETLRSEYYDMRRNVYSPSQHMKFSVTATYTLGYGKKVQRGDEMGGSGTGQSAILK